jgi:hypothetical protein
MTLVRLAHLTAIMVASVNGQSSITIDDVKGLRDLLNQFVIRSAGFTSNRTAVADDSGMVSSITGNLNDCVYVGGTSGPCVTVNGVNGDGTSFSDAEVPSGLLDGRNRVFALAAEPAPPGSLQVYRNGILLKSGADYTLDKAVITFSSMSGATPQPNDLLQCFYRVVSSSTQTRTVSGVREHTDKVALEEDTVSTFVQRMLKSQETTDSQELRRSLRRGSTSSPAPTRASTSQAAGPLSTDALPRIVERLKTAASAQDRKAGDAGGAGEMTTATAVTPVSARAPSQRLGPVADPASTSEAVSRLMERLNGPAKAVGRQERVTSDSATVRDGGIQGNRSLQRAKRPTDAMLRLLTRRTVGRNEAVERPTPVQDAQEDALQNEDLELLLRLNTLIRQQ